RHNGFVVHAWLHRAGCRAVRTARSRRAIVPFTHLAREGRMTVTIGRRELLAALGGAAAAWPLAARAQQGGRLRRVGGVMSVAEGNPVGQARLAAFRQGLLQLGWADGRNVRIDSRWGADNASLTRTYARELVALAPDVVMAVSSGAVAPLREVTRTVPIVFAVVAEPVGAGYVGNLAQPGGNVTGLLGYENTPDAQWTSTV